MTLTLSHNLIDIQIVVENMNNDTIDIEFKYLIVNEADRRYGITVNTVGFQSIHPNDSYPVKNHPKDHCFNENSGRRLDEFQFIYITKGCGELTIESTEKQDITQGQLIIIFPGQWHKYSPQKLIGWNEYYIGFNGEIIQELVKNSFLEPQSQILDVGLNEELVTLFKRALEIVEQEKTGHQQHLSGIVMHMIGLILYESNNNRIDISKHFQIIENSKIIMNENIFNALTPEEVANRLGMEYTKFRRLFKRITGFSPAQYFQELKMKKAKQLLLETGQPVKEISYLLNYQAPEHFVTLFKQKTGLTPTEYRKFSR